MNKALLSQFIGRSQLQCLAGALRGEEAEYFETMLAALVQRIETMPKTYEQDGKGDAAVIHLHYFHPCGDWWITEKDAETPDEPGQHQAFGLVDLGDGPELGYISIVELLRCNIELDLYWTPKTIGDLKREILERGQRRSAGTSKNIGA